MVQRIDVELGPMMDSGDCDGDVGYYLIGFVVDDENAVVVQPNFGCNCLLTTVVPDRGDKLRGPVGNTL